MSQRDSTITAPVSAYHRGSYAERDSRFKEAGVRSIGREPARMHRGGPMPGCRADAVGEALASIRVIGTHLTGGPGAVLSSVGFLRVIIRLVFLPSCLSLSLLLPETSRGRGQRQPRQG